MYIWSNLWIYNNTGRVQIQDWSRRATNHRCSWRHRSWICNAPTNMICATLVFTSRQSVVKKAKHYGYLPSNFEHVHTLVECMESNLFHSVLYNPNRVLYQLLPPVKDTIYNLLQPSHSLTLSSEDSNLIRNNFLHRMLYKDIYLPTQHLTSLCDKLGQLSWNINVDIFVYWCWYWQQCISCSCTKLSIVPMITSTQSHPVITDCV